MRNQPSVRTMGTAAVVLLALSCGQASEPVPDRNLTVSPPVTHVTLHVGETVVVNHVDITFNAVLEDSRCPVDVTCVWEGNARIELGVGPGFGGDGPTIQMILNTSLGLREGEAWGQRITLVDVRPAPVSTEPIPADAYEVDLKVERIGRPDDRDATRADG